MIACSAEAIRHDSRAKKDFGGKNDMLVLKILYSPFLECTLRMRPLGYPMYCLVSRTLVSLHVVISIA